MKKLTPLLVLVLLLHLWHAQAASRYDVSDVISPHVRQEEMQQFYSMKYAGAKAKTQCVKDNQEKNFPDPDPDTNNNPYHQIFLLPHTHDDVGWQYTVFGYFNNSVRHILDSVTADLGSHPEHRFIWSEIKWIEMWWPLQNETTKSI